MDRRTFIKSAATASLGLTTGVYARSKPPKTPMFIGTTVFPDELYARGIGSALDEMRELAGINTVMPFTHTHVARQYRPNAEPRTDADGNVLTDVYVRTHDSYYADPRMIAKDPASKYADRDILDELHEEATPRNMAVFARILEPYWITGVIPGFEAFAETAASGERGDHVCFNHPGYIAWWHSVVEDLIRSHPHLHGFKFGQERGGPLLTALGGEDATCFCEHCQSLAKSKGSNVKEAREGFIAIRAFGDRIRSGNQPVDGNFVAFLRLLGQYPSVLAWERLFMESREAQRKRMYAQIKGINPDVQVGWHIDHGMTWDLITRAFEDYSTKGAYSDWLSVALYFDSMGRRSTNHFEKNYARILFGDASEETAYKMYLSLLGYPPGNQPPLSTHRNGDTAFSADYVFQETQRAVQATNGGAKVYARIGFDMPGYDCNVQPEQVKAAVKAALKAGADGLWCGREWAELNRENAKAFGDTVRAHAG